MALKDFGLEWDTRTADEYWEQEGSRLLARRSSAGRGFRVGQHVSGQGAYELPLDALHGHLHVVGATRKGKSYFLEQFMRRLTATGSGYFLGDPHGFLYDHMVNWFAHNPQFADKVVLFNPSHAEEFWPGFNPLRRVSYFPDIAVQVRHITNAAAQVWEEESKTTPRLRRWMGNMLYPLIENECTFLETQYFTSLNSSEVKMKLLAGTANSRIRNDWLDFDRLSRSRKLDEIGSLQNRLTEFTDNQACGLILGRTKNLIDIPDLVEGGKIVLADFSSRGGRLHPDDAFMLGTLWVNEFTNYAFSRTEELGKTRPFYLILDEFQSFLTDDVATILDQQNKFGMHLVLSHQHLAQIREERPKMFASIMTNAPNKVIFGGLAGPDLEILESEVFMGEHNLKEIKQEIYRTTVVDYDDEEVYTEGHVSSGGGGMTYDAGDGWFSSPEQLGSSIFSSETDISSYSSRLRPVLDKELASRTFFSLPEQSYKNQALMKRQPTQRAIIKAGDEPTAIVEIDDVTQPARDGNKLVALHVAVLAKQSEYYLPKGEILALTAERQRVLEESQQEDAAVFHSSKPLRLNQPAA